KKVFANMKRVGTEFSGEVTSLFDNMLVQAPEEVGILQDDAQPIPTEPLISKPQKKHKPKRKYTKEPETKKIERKVERLEEENRVLNELKSVHSTVDSDKPVMEKEGSSRHERKIADIDADVEINLEKVQVEAYNVD
nr:hypothetical protein [Tanacetum cinerariifolium]